MKKGLIITLSFCSLLMVYAFNTFTEPKIYPRDKITPIPEYPQRTTGDAAEGWDYLRYGNYIGAGVPYSIFKLSLIGNKPPNYLNREGESGKIPHVFNLFEEQGVELVGGLNCFGCHAGSIDGEFYAGLGSHTSDFAKADNGKFFNRLEKFVRLRYGKKSVQYEAYTPLFRGSEYVTPYITTPFMGVNPAFKLEEAAVAHRHSSDLTWADGEQTFPLTKQFYASDVPPLWNVKKKNALYYNGMGRGDFTKLLMQVMVVAIEDSTEAREINDKFDHVLAWLNSLEAPKYPKEVDANLVEKGEAIFENTCSKCHGFYSDNPEDELYPNKLVGLDVVKTDSFYAVYSHQNDNFTNWLNDSWIMKSEPRAWVQPELGYIAPPLDGVWVTAPYLHNGSVPTLAALLDSDSRPTYWQRKLDGPRFDDKEFDYENVGWKFTETEKGGKKNIYDTTVEGYGNGGHYFGDDLSEGDRKATTGVFEKLCKEMIFEYFISDF